MLAAQKEWRGAEAAFRRSLAVLEEIGSRLELGRTRYAYAQLLRAKGDSDKAEREAKAALAIFKETGARPDEAKVRDALARWKGSS